MTMENWPVLAPSVAVMTGLVATSPAGVSIAHRDRSSSDEDRLPADQREAVPVAVRHPGDGGG